MNDAEPPEYGVAPDGCPVRLYLLIPGDDEAAVVHGAIPPGAAILELGCGVGRVSRPLVQHGHAVTGIDNSPEMLTHFEAVDGTEAILADIATLDLSPRRWPVVMLPSHFVNDGLGGAFLAVAARHVSHDGCVIVQRYPPGWVDTVVPSNRDRPGITSSIGNIERSQPGTMRATMVYEFEGRRYEQGFTAHDVDDARLAEMAAPVGLAIDEVLDDDRQWVRLRPSQFPALG
jgi:SAM-dependent methyltransferase